MARIRMSRPGSKPAWPHISPAEIRAALEPLLGAEFRFVLIAERDEAGYTAGRGWSDPEETAEDIFRDAYEAHLETKAGLGYEDAHRVAVARELCAKAGVPLRDRYGWAASDETVLFVVGAVFAEEDDAEASGVIGGANALGDIELAQAPDEIASEEFELRVIKVLRPLVASRNAAEARAALW